MYLSTAATQFEPLMYRLPTSLISQSPTRRLMLLMIGLVVTVLYIKRSCKEKHARAFFGARGWRMVRKFREQDDSQLVARAKICWYVREWYSYLLTGVVRVP